MYENGKTKQKIPKMLVFVTQLHGISFCCSKAIHKSLHRLLLLRLYVHIRLIKLLYIYFYIETHKKMYYIRVKTHLLGDKERTCFFPL